MHFSTDNFTVAIQLDISIFQLHPHFMATILLATKILFTAVLQYRTCIFHSKTKIQCFLNKGTFTATICQKHLRYIVIVRANFTGNLLEQTSIIWQKYFAQLCILKATFYRNIIYNNVTEDNHFF